MAGKTGRFRKLIEVEDVLPQSGNYYDGLSARLVKQNGIKPASKSRIAQ